MIGRYFYIFLLSFLVIFLFFPQIVLGQEAELQLNDEDVELLFNITHRKLRLERTLMFSDVNFRPADQAAILVIQDATQREMFSYFFKELPEEFAIKFIKTALKAVYLIYTAEDWGEIIGKIEKMTVDKAKEKAIEWLLQKEIKIAGGNLNTSFKSYKGDWENPTFQYVIVYHPLDSEYAKVAIEFHSPRPIEPPQSTWGTPCELKEELKPFILKVSGIVENSQRTYYAYTWVGRPEIEVSFPEEVPELVFPKISFWEKTLSSVKKRIRALEIGVEMLGDFAQNTNETIQEKVKKALNKIKSIFSEVNPFKAAIAPMSEKSKELWEKEPLEIPLPGLEIPAEPSEVEPTKAEEIIPEETGPKRIDEIAESVDDIAEQIDILSQAIAGLAKARADSELKLSPEGAPEETGDGEKIGELGEKIEEIIEEAEKVVKEEVEGVKEAIEELSEGQIKPAGLAKDVKICQKVGLGFPAQNKVIINEVAWMGTEASGADEWIELKNISNEPVNLANWQLLDKDGQIEIIFEQGQIEPDGFFLLERSDNNSVPNIAADFVFTGALNDNDEALYLFSPNCQFEDVVEALPDWPAGERLGRKSMERSSDLNWHTFSGLTQAGILGTPGAENSQPTVVYHGGAPPAGPALPVEEEVSLPKILITEVQITGQKADHDFIELYNPKQEPADISGYQLKKRNQSGSEYSIRLLPENTIISVQSYWLWANSKEDYHTILQADASSTTYLTTNDSIALLDKEKKIVDALAWGDGHQNPFLETAPFLENPKENQSLERKKDNSNNYIDTDNNSNDFELQNCPNPKGQVITCYSPPEEEQPPGQEQPPEEEPKEEPEPEPEPEPGPEPEEELEKLAQTIVINEIAWMGTMANSVDEWLELKNNTQEPIEILNWQLIFYPSGGKEPRITNFDYFNEVTPSIDGLDYFLLERTDDETISDLEADYIFKGALNDEGGILELRDNQGALIDKVDCQNSWFAGQKINRISMERIDSEVRGSDPAIWRNNNLITRQGKDADKNPINGTPKSENSVSKSPTEIIGKLPFDEFDEINLSFFGSPYLVRWEINVPKEKTLTIEPGVVIKFYDTYSGLLIDGTLKAIGGEGGDFNEKKIVFTSYFDDQYGGDTNKDGDRTKPSIGSWKGIYFSEKSCDSELVNTVIRYGGGLYDVEAPCPWQQAGVRVEKADITFKDSIIEHNKRRGLWLINSSSFIENVQFIDNPVCQGYFGKYGGIGISIEGGDPTVKNCSFKKNVYGIYISEWVNSEDNTTHPATPIVENNIFEENEKPIAVNSSCPFFKGNSATNNKFNGVFVEGFISQDTIWSANLPYIIRDTAFSIAEETRLTIEAGAVIKLQGEQANLSVSGTLIARGTKEELIVFTSLFDDQYGGDTNNDGDKTSASVADWKEIYFTTTSRDSELVNVIVRYGGGLYDVEAPCPWQAAGIRVDKTSITLKDSVLSHNKEKGLYLIDSQSVVENSQFVDNPVCKGYFGQYGGCGVLIEGGTPTIKSSLFKKNIYGIYISRSEPILEDLMFGLDEEANQCNIFKEGQCINPAPLSP